MRTDCVLLPCIGVKCEVVAAPLCTAWIAIFLFRFIPGFVPVPDIEV